MKRKLLNLNDVEKICANCENGIHTPDGCSVLCNQRGVVAFNSTCRKFSYDPLNRIPKRPLKTENFSPEEFIL